VLSAIGERRDVDVYICGLRLMVDDMRARLKELGYDRKRIVFERYDRLTRFTETGGRMAIFRLKLRLKHLSSDRT
jgi:ferredoxin-NADP reductase